MDVLTHLIPVILKTIAQVVFAIGVCYGLYWGGKRSSKLMDLYRKKFVPSIAEGKEYFLDSTMASYAFFSVSISLLICVTGIIFTQDVLLASILTLSIIVSLLLFFVCMANRRIVVTETTITKFYCFGSTNICLDQVDHVKSKAGSNSGFDYESICIISQNKIIRCNSYYCDFFDIKSLVEEAVIKSRRRKKREEKKHRGLEKKKAADTRKKQKSQKQREPFS